MSLLSLATRRGLAADTLRRLPVPVVTCRLHGQGARLRLDVIHANEAAATLPPPDTAWAQTCLDAVRADAPRSLGDGAPDGFRVQALPLRDDVVALVYLDAASAPAGTAPAEAPAEAPEAVNADALKILDAIPDVVLVYPLGPDGPGPMLAFNEAALHTYGYSAEALGAMRVTDLVDPARVSVPAILDELRRSRAARFDSVHRTADDRRLPMQVAARLVEFDGQLCVLAVCRDDSERRAFRRQMARDNASLERRISERTAELERFVDNLQILHRTTTNPHHTLAERAQAYLDAGCEMFGLPNGIVSSVYPDADAGGILTYRIDALRTDGDAMQVGAALPLSATFCDDVMEAGDTVSFGDAAADDRVACIAAFAERGLRAFIGTPVRVGDQIVGTLNFSSPVPRPSGFSSHEHDLIEIMASALGQRILADGVDAIAPLP